MLRLWTARWNLLRLGVAAFILWALAADSAARLARLQLAALPDMDFPAEVVTLREQGRFGEAVMIADAGLAVSTGSTRERLIAERDATLAAQASWIRKAKEFGLGALSGQGQSLEALVGAVTLDLFVVGDVRDLAIQSAKLVVDGEADPVIAGLSAIGIGTTVLPEVDWAASLLKIARKSGAMTTGLAEWVKQAVKRGEKQALTGALADAAALAGKTSPATALRLLRTADHPDDLARLAGFLSRNSAGSGGALALHVAGDEAAALLKAGAKGGSGALEAEAVLIKAARKGTAGAGFLRSSAARVLAKPHPLIGLAKGFYKGNLEALAARVAERLDPQGWWTLPAIAAWAFLELGLLWRKLASRTGSNPYGLSGIPAA